MAFLLFCMLLQGMPPNDHMQLVVIGFGPTREDEEAFFEKIAELNLRNHVHFLGRLGRAETTDIPQGFGAGDGKTEEPAGRCRIFNETCRIPFDRQASRGYHYG